ncbi:thioredoxin family protein [Alphaproteobacteria bacterium]|nr:thioredoxin family protein [Alphaproteobacteria bacterium]
MSIIIDISFFIKQILLMTSIHFSKKYIYTPIIVFLIFITSIFQSVDAKDTSLMIMITDKNCLYCIVWEKQIGKIYPKTEIAKKFSLHRIEVKNFVNYTKYDLKKTNITPTFIFIKNDNEVGRIEGYTNPEMFWWQVDEIIDN